LDSCLVQHGMPCRQAWWVRRLLRTFVGESTHSTFLQDG
jgi:hypothetical protein